MSLLHFIQDESRKQELAKRVGCSPAYLYQIATGWKNKRPSPELARDIELRAPEVDASIPVRCESLRPDLQWVRDRSGAITGFFSPLDA